MEKFKKVGKVYFFYGAMGSSKTAFALMKHYNFKEKGQNPILLKPSLDTRDGIKTIKSRIGIQQECMLLEDFLELPSSIISSYSAIVLDEAQFSTAKQIDSLVSIVDKYAISAYCYGLRTDFRNQLFSGSQRLFALADEIEELETICFCGEKATCNARYNENNIVVYSGEQIELGANDRYVSLCRKHYNEGILAYDYMHIKKND